LRIPRIHTQQELRASTSINLEAKAVKHIKDVLRMNIGNEVILFNGDGHDYTSTISELSKKSISVTIESKQTISNESPVTIHLLQPLCRAEKMDWCLQKATELGVNEITPFISARVNINIAANRVEKKMDHWRSVIESACEQSGRATVPNINPPTAFSVAINNSTKECIKLIASPSADKTTLSSADISTTSCLCAIGPEGGFNQDEILQAQYQDFISIKMGPRILRLETAVISALTLCQSRWGDFN
jgi:16S rRNA (uracil1498-N3)-methyltransferase|tara:strand:+ start:527 stop:1264 length:738 start_codon:yes stop_codon:yes gene_type:complete